MKVVFDESGFWWKWFWWTWILMNVDFWWMWIFDENFFFDESGFDELVLYLQNSVYKEFLEIVGNEKSDRSEQNQDLRCQSGPSAKNSVIFSRGESFKNYGTDQERLQISDLLFDKFPTPATFACWKIKFKTERCICSQFPTEAMQWIQEVEMCRILKFSMRGSLQRGTKSSSNSHFKTRISPEEQKAQKEDRFLRGRQIGHLIYDYFRVTGAHDSVENYADLFTISLRNDDIQEFDSKWDGLLLSMTKIPPDDILEGLCKFRIRESEKLRTVLELYDLEIHQKKWGLDYHRLQTMVKRSIEQEIRNMNFGARNRNYEKNAVVKNQGTKQRVQRILGDCWQWETNGQSVKGDNCSYRHDINKRGKVTPSNPSPSSSTRQNERNASRTRSPRRKSPSGRMFQWIEYTFIQNRFHPLTFSSKHDFIQWHFHPKTVSSNDTFIQDIFIQQQFHPTTISSNDIFNQERFHPKHHMWYNQYSPCLCEGVTGRRLATPSHKHGLCPAFRVSTGLHVKHRRPKAGDASPEGLLKVEKREV